VFWVNDAIDGPGGTGGSGMPLLRAWRCGPWSGPQPGPFLGREPHGDGVGLGHKSLPTQFVPTIVANSDGRCLKK